MKKTWKMLSALVLLAGLAACGGKGGDTSATPDSSAAGKPTSSKVASSKHEHTYAETWEHNETQHWHPATCEHSTQNGSAASHTFGEEKVTTPSTCTADGAGEKSCTVCGYKETTVIKAGHKWGTPTALPEESDCAKLTSEVCSGCGATRYSWAATDFNKLSGTNIGESDGYFKLKTAGDLAQYQIKLPKAGEATFFLYGYIDYFKDGSTNNDQRGFFSGKNGDTENGNFSVSVGSTTVDISSKKGVTYEQMGITGDTAEGAAWVEVGECNITSEYTTVTMTRLDSYNMLNIKMGIIYK